MSARRRFVVIGRRALASEDFLLDDLPSSSGRLDVLARCMRSALLFSHGVRVDTVLYLVLLAGGRAPRTVRVDGATAKFLRPDERSMAILLQKSLASRADDDARGFVEVRPGISLARGGLDMVLEEFEALGKCTLHVLEEGAEDIRGVPLDGDRAFVLGDDRGFDEATREKLATLGARPLGVGPKSLHTEDALTIVVNELDRR